MKTKLLRLLPLVVLLALTIAPGLANAQTPGPCAGFTSTLAVGRQGHVTPGSPNNVRRLPGTGAGNNAIGQIPGDSIFSTIGGPVCANNITWWQVSYQGLVGWTGEGRGAERWLDTNTSQSSAPRTPLNGLEGTSKSVLFVHYGCFLDDGQPLGRAVVGDDIQTLGNGGYTTFSLSDGLDAAPDLCVPAELVSSAYAVTPFGTVIPQVVGGQVSLGAAQLTLPYWAYGVPGLWQLGVSGFSIYIDVRLATQPLFELEAGQVVLGGFAPNERLVIVTGAAGSASASSSGGSNVGALADNRQLLTLNNTAIVAALNNQVIQPTLAPSAVTALQLAGQTTDLIVSASELQQVMAAPDLPSGQNRYDNLTGTAVVADANGFYTGPNPASGEQRVLAVVGATSTVLYSPNMNIVQFAGSDPESSRRTLFDAFFGGGSAVQPQPQPGGGTGALLAGPVQVGTSWQTFREVFAADDGVVYALRPDGDLLWYFHYGHASGAPDWAGANVVGTGWNGFTRAFAGDAGSVYGITPSGELYWYRHDGAYDGTVTWVGGVVVGTGWNGFRDVFAGDDGVIYAITGEGNLLWYRHYGYGDGTFNWAGPNTVGRGGWNGFADVFAGEDGVIYGLYPNGDLFRYVHDGYQDGTGDVAARVRIANGWNQYVRAFAGEGNALYAIAGDGVLYWFSYTG